MKPFLRAFALSLFSAAAVLAAEVKKIAPADAAKLVLENKAVIVDVREPAEWAETGVASPAVLLPMSDFNGERKLWKHFLKNNPDKEIILYCRSGHRAGLVAGRLAAEGRDVANAGAFKDWQAAGLPVRKP